MLKLLGHGGSDSSTYSRAPKLQQSCLMPSMYFSCPPSSSSSTSIAAWRSTSEMPSCLAVRKVRASIAVLGTSSHCVFSNTIQNFRVPDQNSPPMGYQDRYEDSRSTTQAK